MALGAGEQEMGDSRGNGKGEKGYGQISAALSRLGASHAKHPKFSDR
jgi:hypothetical protein